MTNTAEQLYLTLMKQVLTFSLWPEPPIPLERLNYAKPPLKRFIVSCISRILKRRDLQIDKQFYYTEAERRSGMIWPVYADTMIGFSRLDNIQNCIETVINENIQGDLIETGVWRGGACIFMKAVLAVYGVESRKVFVADSFQGLPKPEAKTYPADKHDKHHTHEILAVSQDEVEHNFRKYGLLDDSVIFLKGWFKDTLPNAPIDKLSVMRLDGDMYSSTMEALTSLYPKLSIGGFCIIDDYDLQGCKSAVDDFRRHNGIESEIKVVDYTGRFWRKE